jgi:hypothetical protein
MRYKSEIGGTVITLGLIIIINKHKKIRYNDTDRYEWQLKRKF